METKLSFHLTRLFPCLVALALNSTPAIANSTQAEEPREAIPWGQIGAKATADYQGEALGVTATPDGARLCCGFQKLEGRATPQGLWLESTVPGGGRFRLVAVAVGRGGSREPQCAPTEAANSVRSGISLVTFPQPDQAPLGAPCTQGAASLFDMPLLTELETTFSDVPCYRHAAPNGAIAGLRQGAQRLARTGIVSVEDKLVRFVRPGVTEEYSVSVDGVRQDFIIESPPLNLQRSTLNQSVGDLRVELAVSGARAEGTAYGARLILEGSWRALAYSRLHVTDANGKELKARLEVKAESRKQRPEMSRGLLTSAATKGGVAGTGSEETGVGLVVVVEDAGAVYPVRIDPTFSDANWISMGGARGVDDRVNCAVVDGSGNLYIGGVFLVAGDTVANYVARWNGSSWSALGSGMNNTVYALAFSGSTLIAGGQFTTAGGVAANYVAQWDGSSWSALGSGMDGPVYSLAVSGGRLFAGGEFTMAGDTAANCVAQWDGSSWSALGSGMDVFFRSPVVYALAVSGGTLYAGGYFSVAGDTAANNVAQWDGSSWSPLGLGMDADVYALAVSGGVLYAGGSFTTADGDAATKIAQWDGSGWSPLGLGMNDAVHALGVSGGTLYAGGYFTSAGGTVAPFVAQWDGNSWSALGTGMNGQFGDFGVFALVVSGDTLYAGGYFGTAGGTGVDNIAAWNGSSWLALGSGMNGPVTTFAASGSTLYVGGSFSSAGATTVNFVAQWNGTNWSGLGSGLDTGVSALAIFEGTLYAGNAFNGIAQWNGSNWSAVESGMDGGVLALAVSGGTLYAAGFFTTAGGKTVNHVAQWNGSSWSALGSGMNNTVETLAVSGGSLYAGGDFTSAGGKPANHVALWNGSSWSALGSGMNSYVMTLAVSGGSLYAGGDFTTAGGMPASHVAQWDGSSWSALGSGMNDWVQALAVSGGTLYAGGAFTSAGGNAANYVAQWDGSSWSPLGSGMNRGVVGLAVLGGALYAGGWFTTAGSKVCGYVAESILDTTTPVTPLDIVTTNGLFGFDGGQFRFTVTGPVGSNAVVQASTDLQTWVPLVTNPLSLGSFSFTDTVATNYPRRYYRAQLLP